MSAAERKKRWDAQMRNADGQVPDQPKRAPVVLYLSDEARQILQDQRQLASQAKLPALLDSEMVEAALSQFAGGFAGPMGGNRHRELLEQFVEQGVRLVHLQNLYWSRYDGDERKDVQTRKRWFQEVAQAHLDAPVTASPQDVAEACGAAIRAASGYHVKNLTIDLAAVMRETVDFDEREAAMAARLCAFVDLVLGAKSGGK